MTSFFTANASRIKGLKDHGTDEHNVIRECFQTFTAPDKTGIDIPCFESLVQQLFVNDETGQSFAVPRDRITQYFRLFDRNHDDLIDWQEFQLLWQTWIFPLFKTMSALVIVDVQNDFITGSMAKLESAGPYDGADVIPVINRMIEGVAFDLVVYVHNVHPEDHISFLPNLKKRKAIHEDGTELSASELDDVSVLQHVLFEGPPRTRQQMLPIHCLVGSWGAELHPDLLIRDHDVLHIDKGMDPTVHSFSAFWDDERTSETSLHRDLVSRGISDVFVCGLVYDYCVGRTALHAREHGFKTTLVEDASGPYADDSLAEMKDRLKQADVALVNTDHVSAMVRGVERRPDVGHQVFLNLELDSIPLAVKS